MAGPRSYTPKTLKRLFALSNNTCGFPGCARRLTSQENAVDSNICHIEAANPEGERYNLDMEDIDRADYKNLILLCPPHHVTTNDVDKYTVEILKEMKTDHESEQLLEKITNNPSMLYNLIKSLSEIDFTDSGSTAPHPLIPYSPREKIKFNDLSRSVPIIDAYKIYHSKLSDVYSLLEQEGSIKESRLLDVVKNKYLEIKGKYVGDAEDQMPIIREFSDEIFAEVHDSFYSDLSTSKLFDEDIMIALRVVLVDAFIRCKILENPISNAS